MEDSPKEVFIAGTNAVNETLKYSCATAEYSGLVSLSYIRRGGCFIYDPIAKAVEPVCDVAVNACKKTAESITSAYNKTGDGIGWAYKKTGSGLSWLADAVPMPFGGKRMRAVEERLQKIEEWMAHIEEKGLMMPAASRSGGQPKKLSDDKEALLKTILLENMDLMG